MENNENLKICSLCGEKKEKEFGAIIDNNFICEGCLYDNYFYCEECGEWVHNDYSIYIDNTEETICESCYDNGQYFYCEECSQNVNGYSNTAYRNNREFIVCDNCLNDCYIECSQCGDYHHESNIMHGGEYEDEPFCESCYREYSQTKELYNYHEFNDWQFLKNENETPKYYTGFELEVYNTCNQYEGLQAVNKNLPCVCMEDSSIGGVGFEIVSQPMTKNYFLNNKEKFKNVFNELINLGFTSHEAGTCGLHFHVTRPKSDNVINNIWLILETFKNELTIFSRRELSELKRWGAFLSDEFKENEKLKNSCEFVKDKKNEVDRRHALNISNTRTIEFRFLRGTLNFKTFMASYELIQNIIELAERENVEGITWADLTKGEYASIYSQNRGITSTTILKDYSLEYLKNKNYLRAKKQNLLLYINRILIKQFENLTINKKTKDILNELDIINNKISHLKSNLYHINDFKYFVNNDYDFNDFCYRLNSNLFLDKETREKIDKYIKNIKNEIEKEGAKICV